MPRLSSIRMGLIASAVGIASFAGSASAAFEPTHELLLTNGETIKVEILEDGDAELRVNVYYGSLSAPRSFKRSEIITITELAGGGEAEAAAGDGAQAARADADRPADAVPVYAFEFEGQLGSDISATPLRKRMAEAREAGAEYVIIKINNERTAVPEWVEDMADDIGSFDTLFFAEALVAPLTSEVRADWREQPKIVFWVERAMEGMAFIPLLRQEVYFTSDGRMGGVGNLDDLFGSTGDEVVRDKQESLRLQQVNGYAIEGGHDTAIVEGMTRRTIALWYRLENGEVKFFKADNNNPPLEGGWIRLTDTGEDEFEDTDRQIVRLEGNDTLTLDADTAFKIGFSKGTADTMDDLLFELGIEDRAWIIDDEDDDGFTDSADYIGETWSRGITSARRTIQNIERDIAAIRVPDTVDGDRRQQVIEAQTIKILRRAIRLATQYAEVLDPNEQLRVNLELRIQQIENEIRRRRVGGGG